ncbi:MAG: sulfur oxidation c-type cytochrome SoxX [Rhodomicrobium sp.]
MAKLRMYISIAVTSCIGASLVLSALSGVHAAECQRKTAGFYLEDTNAGVPHNLSSVLQNLPGPLTGAPGNAERGREVLVSRQKGDCLSCHKVSVLSSIAGQGGIGPALDGVGSKYDDAQLRQVLVEPKTYYPETIMPSYYREGAAAASVLTAAEIEDLVAYLKTLR